MRTTAVRCARSTNFSPGRTAGTRSTARSATTSAPTSPGTSTAGCGACEDGSAPERALPFSDLHSRDVVILPKAHEKRKFLLIFGRFLQSCSQRGQIRERAGAQSISFVDQRRHRTNAVVGQAPLNRLLQEIVSEPEAGKRSHARFPCELVECGKLGHEVVSTTKCCPRFGGSFSIEVLFGKVRDDARPIGKIACNGSDQVPDKQDLERAEEERGQTGTDCAALQKTRCRLSERDAAEDEQRDQDDDVNRCSDTCPPAQSPKVRLEIHGR